MTAADKHLYDLGIIGNCAFIAYIDRLASLRWLCLPRFDSQPLFDSLLRDNQSGDFGIASARLDPLHQYYCDNTNILCTELAVEGGTLRVTDFAPRFEEHGRTFKPTMVIRKLEPTSGDPRLRVHCRPAKPNGGPETEAVAGSHHIHFSGYAAPVRLTTDLPLAHLLEGNSFSLSTTRYLILTYGPPLEAPITETAERFLAKTQQYWQAWIKSTSISGLFQAMVIRSALVLKLHQFEDTGAIIAAGTTSLPESPGAGRNWDYRYCWMRDSYYTLRAFADIGHFDEMERFFYFVQDIVATRPEAIPPLFTVTGQGVGEEITTDWPGYRGNRPVRFGNDARKQQQYDVYGQLLVAILPLFVDRRLATTNAGPNGELVAHLIRLMDRDFDQPDAGIWEYRNRSQAHCYTYLFHWAGAQAAIRMSLLADDTVTARRAAILRDRAAATIEDCFVPTLSRYGQAVGEPAADASTLQLITMGYLDHQPTRAAHHLAGLERELVAPGGLLYRYRHADDFGEPETTFLATAFWRAEAMACVGRAEEARDLVGSLVGYTNHLGLLAEDVGLDGSQWGNFPQTYSHVGLMNAVSRIARKLDRPFFLEDLP